MRDKSNPTTKNDLYAMLAEAVRNTQPQPEPEPIQNAPRKVKKERAQPAKGKRRRG